jgi:hypothetical protein
VEEAPNAGSLHRRHDVLDRFAVHPVERLSPFLVDDPDEVNDRITSGERGRERSGVEHVSAAPFDRMVVPVARAIDVPGEHGDVVAAPREGVDEVRSDETGSTRYE